MLVQLPLRFAFVRCMVCLIFTILISSTPEFFIPTTLSFGQNLLRESDISMRFSKLVRTKNS